MKVPKSLITLALVLSFLSLVAVSTVKARPVMFHLGLVTGVFTRYNTPAGTSGAAVTVVCSHLGVNRTLLATTDINGVYSVVFTDYGCTAGDSVTVTATKGTLIGTSTGVLHSEGVVLDTAIVNISL